jgi:hypothetical protein
MAARVLGVATVAPAEVPTKKSAVVTSMPWSASPMSTPVV